MTLAEKLVEEFEQLTEEKEKELENLMDSVIAENKEALKKLAK